jgi:hypothetical protein
MTHIPVEADDNPRSRGGAVKSMIHVPVEADDNPELFRWRLDHSVGEQWEVALEYRELARVENQTESEHNERVEEGEKVGFEDVSKDHDEIGEGGDVTSQQHCTHSKIEKNF